MADHAKIIETTVSQRNYSNPSIIIQIHGHNGDINQLVFMVEYRLDNGYLAGTQCPADRILYPGELYDPDIQCHDLRFLINFERVGCTSDVNELIIRRRIRNVFELFCPTANHLNFSDSDDTDDSIPERRVSDSDPCRLDA